MSSAAPRTPPSPDHIPQPPTPLSPTGSDSPTTASDSPAAPPSVPATNPPPKRKPSRRANTAERRATHNAVERQRRETLNGRFLDLAALLPNLATVRRPSKSAIVNSSIALIHSQRRGRAAAGRELRALEAEADALRREVNEWRARSGAALPALLVPQRSPDFLALAGAEDTVAGAEEEERRAYALAGAGIDDDDDLDLPDDLPRGVPIPVPVPPAGPTAAPPGPGSDADKLAQWNAHLQYALAQQQQHQQQQQAQAQAQMRQPEWVHHQAQQAALFTPPSTAHGHDGAPATDVFAGFSRSFTSTSPAVAHFAYGVPVFAAPAGAGGTPEMDDSGTESTDSPSSAGHGHGPSHPHAPPHGTALFAGAFPRRPSVSMGHPHQHLPQQHPHPHPHQPWATGAQFPPVSLII